MILITGGAGYIGSHVNKVLYKRGYETLVLDNLSYGHKEFVRWGQFVLCDLENIEAIRLIFKKYPILAVIHLAAFAYVGESMKDPQKYYINNVRNTLNLLQVMIENDVEYLIFSSTCAVYGIPCFLPITEEHPTNPINPYGKSKLFIEKILEDYSAIYGLKYISLRYFNAAGADPDLDIGEWHEPETHLIPIILDVALGKRDFVPIFGTDYPTPDGTCVRDFIHVTDLAEAHVLALEYLLKENRSGIFNLGSEVGFSVKEVINLVEKIIGKKLLVRTFERRLGDPPVLVASSQRAKEVLNFVPKYNDLSIIIKTAWEWHKILYRDFKK